MDTYSQRKILPLAAARGVAVGVHVHSRGGEDCAVDGRGGAGDYDNSQGADK